MLSKKNYIVFAAIFKKHGFNDNSYFLDEIMDYFKKDNSSFDRDRFLTAIAGRSVVNTVKRK